MIARAGQARSMVGGFAVTLAIWILCAPGAAAAQPAPSKAPSRSSPSRPPPRKAAPPKPSAPSAPAPTQQASQEARDLYLKGQRAYEAGDHDHAVQYFVGAYACVPMPPLLFNIAQAYRALGHRAAAIEYYRQFLAANPGSPVAGEVRKRIAELRKTP